MNRLITCQTCGGTGKTQVGKSRINPYTLLAMHNIMPDSREGKYKECKVCRGKGTQEVYLPEDKS